MENEYTVTRWGDIDKTKEPKDYFIYLDTVNNLETIKQMKETTFELLCIQEKERILDVGCGTGLDVLKMAEKVGKRGKVIGVDTSEIMISEAKKRAEGTNLPVEFLISDVRHLDFQDNTFNDCRADRIFVHLDNPVQALSEMIRVSTKGGRIVVSDADWETLVIDSQNNKLTRKILNFFCDSSGTRCVGRQLRRLFIEAGLANVKVSSHTLIIDNYEIANKVFKLEETAFFAEKNGIITSNEAKDWINNFNIIESSGKFFASLTYFFTLGFKNR
jgi:ubiquinone/menaquinone biosynthesis C-methylase UbiE